MRAIQKRIVTDEEMRPVAVQIDYEDWLEIERLMEGREKGGETDSGRFRELLENTKGTWKEGDGLEYQAKLREEWDDR